MEGNIRGQSAAFFESPGFRAFNFALLDRLSTIQQTAQGLTELDVGKPSTQRQLKASLKQLGVVVEKLQQLLEISQAGKIANVHTIHPERLFEHLHQHHQWPRIPQKTYQSLLITVPENTLITSLMLIFSIEKSILSSYSLAFRRRQSNVVARITTPKTDWLSSNLLNILQEGNACLPLQSDSLEMIVLRAIICTLQNYDIKVSINRRQPNCLYLYLPSARQMQVFAQEALEE